MRPDRGSIHAIPAPSGGGEPSLRHGPSRTTIPGIGSGGSPGIGPRAGGSRRYRRAANTGRRGRQGPVRAAIMAGPSASIAFRDVARAAIPTSSSRFQISTTIRARAASSRRATSIDRAGSEGLVGSSKSARRPWRRASPRTSSWAAKWPASRGFEGIDVARERHRQRSTDRLAELDPGLEGRARTLAALDLADPRAAQSDPSPELGLGQPASSGGRPEVAAE